MDTGLMGRFKLGDNAGEEMNRNGPDEAALLDIVVRMRK
jgi:hypothetical protein